MCSVTKNVLCLFWVFFFLLYNVSLILKLPNTCTLLLRTRHTHAGLTTAKAALTACLAIQPRPSRQQSTRSSSMSAPAQTQKASSAPLENFTACCPAVLILCLAARCPKGNITWNGAWCVKMRANRPRELLCGPQHHGASIQPSCWRRPHRRPLHHQDRSKVRQDHTAGWEPSLHMPLACCPWPCLSKSKCYGIPFYLLVFFLGGGRKHRSQQLVGVSTDCSSSVHPIRPRQ